MTAVNQTPEPTEPTEPPEPQPSEPEAPEAMVASLRLNEADLTRLAELIRGQNGTTTPPPPAEGTAAPATEAGSTPTPITVEAILERLNQTLDERDKQIVQVLLEEYGPPRRRGLVSSAPSEGVPAHQLTPEQWRERRRRMAEAMLPTPAAIIASE